MKKKQKKNNRKIKYERAFGNRYRGILCVANVLLFAGFIVLAIVFMIRVEADNCNCSSVSEWTIVARWTTGTMIPPFVALMATYVWMLGRIRRWPKHPINVVSLPFSTGGVLLVMAVVLLAVEPVFDSPYLSAVGLASVLISVGYQFVSALTVVKFWDVQRDVQHR